MLFIILKLIHLFSIVIWVGKAMYTKQRPASAVKPVTQIAVVFLANEIGLHDFAGAALDHVL